MEPDEQTRPAPPVSVIVPVYNSGKELERCLAALSASRFRDFDVWVVDDGSTEAIEPIVNRHGFNYFRIRGPGGPARARNRAAVRTTAEILVFVDADVLVHEDTLERFVAAFEADPAVVAVIGSYDDEPDDPGFISQYKNIFHHFVHQDSHGEIPSFWSGCGAMRRSVFAEFGGFDEERYRKPAIEDIELGTWVSSAGHRILLDTGAQCCHLKRWTFLGMVETDVFGRGVPWTNLMMRVGAANPTLNVKNSQRVSVVLVYLVLAGLLAAAWVPWAGFAAALLLVAVVLLNRDFYRYFAARKGWGIQRARVSVAHALFPLLRRLCDPRCVVVLHQWRKRGSSASPPLGGLVNVGVLPILTYHSLDSTGSVVSVAPRRFVDQMATIDAMGLSGDVPTRGCHLQARHGSMA